MERRFLVIFAAGVVLAFGVGAGSVYLGERTAQSGARDTAMVPPVDETVSTRQPEPVSEAALALDDQAGAEITEWVADRDLSRVDKAVYYATGRGPDPILDMLIHRLGRLTPAQVERYNELHIIPWNQITQYECQSPSTEEIEMTQGGIVSTCLPHYARPHHPYAALSRDELQDLQNEDAERAYFIARRSSLLYTSRGTTIQAHGRAAALAAKPGPLLELSYRVSLDPGMHEDPVSASMIRYMLEFVADSMGDERSMVEQRYFEMLEVAAAVGVEKGSVTGDVNKWIDNFRDEMKEQRRSTLGLELDLGRGIR
jgi:hypothetical protein